MYAVRGICAAVVGGNAESGVMLCGARQAAARVNRRYCTACAIDGLRVGHKHLSAADEAIKLSPGHEGPYACDLLERSGPIRDMGGMGGRKLRRLPEIQQQQELLATTYLVAVDASLI